MIFDNMLLSGDQKIVIIFLSITLTLSGVLVMCRIIEPVANKRFKLAFAYIEDQISPCICTVSSVFHGHSMGY